MSHKIEIRYQLKIKVNERWFVFKVYKSKQGAEKRAEKIRIEHKIPCLITEIKWNGE